jgi:hypothetical protein
VGCSQNIRDAGQILLAAMGLPLEIGLGVEATLKVP